jgi:hypothetical protein
MTSESLRLSIMVLTNAMRKKRIDMGTNLQGGEGVDKLHEEEESTDMKAGLQERRRGASNEVAPRSKKTAATRASGEGRRAQGTRDAAQRLRHGGVGAPGPQAV